MTTRLDLCGTIDALSADIPITLRGQRVRVSVVGHYDELQRRAGHSLGAVKDTTLLRTLAGLPAGEPFSWSMLTSREQRILRGAPSGVIHRDCSSTTRLLVPPLRVQQVTVTARDPRRGLDAASKFAPYACRTLLLPAAVIDNVTRLDAALYGIGIHAQDGSSTQEVVAAAPFVLNRWTWASWLFTEQVLHQLLDRC